MTIRVLLADDQALLRATFRILIDSVEDLTVVAEATDGQEAVDLTAEHRPDVVIMDIRMPNLDGVAAAAAICSRPELSDTHILILTTFENDENVAKALRAGASGFLGKGRAPRSCCRASVPWRPVTHFCRPLPPGPSSPDSWPPPTPTVSSPSPTRSKP